MLTLKMTRISPTHHTLEYMREDGSGEKADIETKSFLTHDLLHFALESEARLLGGFFGLLAKGYSYSQLSGKIQTDHDSHKAMTIEQVVGPLSSVIKGDVDSGAFIETVRGAFAAHGEKIPPWLTVKLVDDVKERYRQLIGHWNSLKFGETLELHFDV